MPEDDKLHRKAAKRQREDAKSGLALLAIAIGLFLGHIGWHQSDGHWSFSAAIIAPLMLFALGAGQLVRALSGLFKRPTAPRKEILRLAQSKNGLLTLSEITTALDLDPETALKALKQLSKSGLATQRWQEYRKNLWEFPDFLQLPIAESLQLAQQHGGRVSLKDLLAQGHSLDIAQQTLQTLSEKGLTHSGPAADNDQAVIITPQ